MSYEPVTFTCPDCRSVKHGRYYGVAKFGEILCSSCYQRRMEATDPNRAAYRKLRDRARAKGLRLPTWAQHNRVEAERFLSVGKRFVVGGWLDPEVQAHHADMMRKYFGEGERLCQDFV